VASRSAYGCGMNFRPFRLALVALSLLGSGPLTAAEKRYAIQDFDRVQVFGPFSVAIQTGRATSVTAMGDQQALDAVSVASSSGVLTVQTIAKARSAWKDEPHAAARLVVTMPQLKGVRLLGTGKIAATEMRGIASWKIPEREPRAAGTKKPSGQTRPISANRSVRSGGKAASPSLRSARSRGASDSGR